MGGTLDGRGTLGGGASEPPPEGRGPFGNPNSYGRKQCRTGRLRVWRIGHQGPLALGGRLRAGAEHPLETRRKIRRTVRDSKGPSALWRRFGGGASNVSRRRGSTPHPAKGLTVYSSQWSHTSFWACASLLTGPALRFIRHRRRSASAPLEPAGKPDKPFGIPKGLRPFGGGLEAEPPTFLAARSLQRILSFAGACPCKDGPRSPYTPGNLHGVYLPPCAWEMPSATNVSSSLSPDRLGSITG